ncbi:MAG TPA: bifunctional tRNA (5-methylaminomethyl-2-thiouridine)(34)-methyltransferase MnmD/FAD-dependent 5-carboxymethylaminomethyl-2-thiouridine(34) oxidoreductase MnmC [Albitalea sp.]|nr:bifunctional tRNA (5-methylaminomethyl-2-thiouridine)(34)-methyltransferase MnmD/FAD-dependent 5-carboxymethylaminomethyl-2-thiouridine(34) oxidoreductase MnmC [Albitalea sp.]
MKTHPIVPALIERTDDGVSRSPQYDDVYHPAAGAIDQARHVFLAGNGLPQRWQGRPRFVVLETGFGLGNNFLATWDAWRRDTRASRRLHFISIEQHPLTREALQALPRDPALAPLAAELVAAWPPLTCNLHRLAFDDERVELLLAFGDVAQWLPELVAQVDAFYLDGFAPAKNPQMWQPRLFKAMGRMAAAGATAATWTAARAVRDGLAAAGFEVELAAGQGGKRDITLARFAPPFAPRRAVSRSGDRTGDAGRVAIVGAGLAGCASAAAFAAQGWSCSVFDRHASPAQEASGNPTGLFHGIVNPQDGTHARFNRAGAMQAQRTVELAIASGRVGGQVQGLLRLETDGDDAAAMQSILDSLGLPPDYVRVLDAHAASALSGLDLRHPAWFYPGGGWVRPGELARHLLERAGSSATWHGATVVDALQRHESGWRLLDAAGQAMAEVDTVVLANAGDALRLLGQPAWPLEKVRGQISILASPQRVAATRLPVAGTGYLLPEVDGRVVFGATSQAGDETPDCRDSDHAENLAKLATLTGRPVDVSPAALQGRVGWRWVSADRLPLIGAVPDLDAAPSARLDQPRFVPRVPGLFVFTGLGSRGIVWCSLGAQVLAAMASGAPVPLEASLLDAIDPARFLSRSARRALAQAPAGGRG